MPVIKWSIGLFFVLLISCSPYESTDSPDPITPEMIVEKMQLSYNTKNLEDYLNCFYSDFQFVLHELDWQYPGPDTCWYRDLDSLFTGNLFEGAYLIELELESSETFSWPDDSTALGMVCPFALNVYTDELSGYRASGNALFRFIEHDAGQWRIDYWKDQSEIPGSRDWSTWGSIKVAF